MQLATVKKEYAWIRAYSPYDNLKAQAYPAMLVNVSLNDSQVGYWEADPLQAGDIVVEVVPTGRTERP